MSRLCSRIATDGASDTHFVEPSRLRYDDGRSGRCGAVARVTSCSRGFAGVAAAGVGVQLQIRQTAHPNFACGGSRSGICRNIGSSFD